MSDDIRLICCSIESGVDPVAGSMPTNCTGCGRGIWVSQQSIEANPEADPWCLPCCLPDLLSGDVEAPQPEAQPIIQALRIGWRPQGEPFDG